MKRWISGTTLILLSLLAAAPAAAQSTATLQGTVTDSQNAILPGTTVSITNTATGAERTAVTDAAGQFVAASLAPGRYTVTAHLDGFAHQTTVIELEGAH